MSPDPTLSFVNGPGALDDLVDPILVDPSPALLTAVIEAYREAAPALVDPDPSTLRAATAATDSLGQSPDSLSSALPRLSLLVTDRTQDVVADRFHVASRLAALVDARVCDLLTLREPQPNTALTGRETGCVLVEHERRAGGDSDAGQTGTWSRVGDEPTLRERYAPLVEAAEEFRLRTPSRRRVYESLRTRCDDAVADDALRALDAEIDGPADDPLDLAGARRRAYVVGARRGALDRNLRRACEDAGLGSPATFTRIKRELREAGLLDTESVPQPVGRPRDRLVARGALAEADGPIAAVAAMAATVE